MTVLELGALCGAVVREAAALLGAERATLFVVDGAGDGVDYQGVAFRVPRAGS